ncbi:MAG: hypothetical protein JWP63_385 [Candidatus Solibacter sp.]|jgi:hypothetical protein|nr:hypothetical protein [Candidatus Solibacter sp.]
MATPTQLTANRVNAQSSTGPRSAEGKAASSRNSLKLGLTAKSLIIAGEDPAELDQLTAKYMDEFEPADVIEEQLVHTLVRAVWMQNRCDRIEAAYLNARVAALPEGTEHPLGVAVIEDASHGDVLTKIFRRRQAAQREWTRSLETVDKMQSERYQRETEQRVALNPAPPRQDRVRFSAPPQAPGVPPQLTPEQQVNLALLL